MKGPSPSQGMKRGRSGVGTLCSAVGPQMAGPPRDFLLRFCLDILLLLLLYPGSRSSRGAAWVWRFLLASLSSKSLQQPIPRRGSQRKQKVHIAITRVTVSLCPEAQGLRWEVWVRSPMRPPFCSSPRLHRAWVLLSASSLPPHNDHGSGRVHSATFSDYILGQMATLTCAGNINHAGSEGTGWLQPHLRWVLKLLTLRSHNSPPESQRSFWAPGQVKPPDHLWALARGRG